MIPQIAVLDDEARAMSRRFAAIPRTAVLDQAAMTAPRIGGAP